MTKLTKQFFVFGFLCTVAFAIIIGGCNSKIEIQNPYERVDWEKHQQYKANLHTHTTHSDGRMSPNTVVDKYHHLGYHILALTDHNEVTYPWTDFVKMEASSLSNKRVENGLFSAESLVYENRDPKKTGMIAIQGNELSSHHHMGSYFSNHNGTKTVEESLNGTADKDGLIIFNHPGRYNFNVDWYIDLLQRYNHLLGLEVYNSGNRYSKDRILWDSILIESMPERLVWGFSNDDMHGGNGLGHNWNQFILPELSLEWVRLGMEEGRFFYIYSPAEHEISNPPQIKSIKVNNRQSRISIESAGYDSIRWISGGRTIHLGENISLRNYPEISNYIRAEICRDSMVIGTQPFGIIRE